MKTVALEEAIAPMPHGAPVQTVIEVIDARHAVPDEVLPIILD
jgi:hypothetical protein